MMLFTNKYLLLGAFGAGAVLAYLAYKGAGKAVEVAKDAAQAINPLNNDNIINRGFTSVYQGVTGSDGTLGGDIYDITHDGTFNPASNHNLINRGVSGIGGAISGNKEWTLGGWIYDVTH